MQGQDFVRGLFVYPIVGAVDSAARGFYCNFAERVFGRSLHFVGAIHLSPADFAVFFPSVTRFARATSPTSGEVCGTGIARSLPCKMYFVRVGAGFHARPIVILSR